ncbi:HEAT repeat domain-containing protein [Paludisphaera sp.]|uniref:HEAT repeat domain-containing protein n=1 Tax=Paludisphaera sp. TaxID=2017432 RepID=UPI00301C966B
MPQGRGTGLWIAGGLAVVAAGAGLFWATSSRRPAGEGASAPTANAAATADGEAFGESSTTAELAQAIRAGDARALAAVRSRVVVKEGEPKEPVTDAVVDDYLELIGAMRAGFLQFQPAGRAATASLAGAMIDRFRVDTVSIRFLEALKPIHDVFAAALTDVDPEVRFVALGETAKFWTWVPGRTLSEIDEARVAEWKDGLHPAVVRSLASKDARTRAAAVYSLGFLPIDAAAAPALAHAADPAVEVRRQVVISFAARRALLTEDMLIQSIHDQDQPIREAAFSALKLRGLNQEQISLGVMMTSPRADQRASVIALVKDRADIDPIVWLMRLSHDKDESVRARAVEALGEQKTDDAAVKRRIVEMAQSDASELVRQAASKQMPSVEETTASLPPLPGSSLLNPKAN